MARFFEAFALNGLHGTILQSIRVEGLHGLGSAPAPPQNNALQIIRGRMAKSVKHSSKSGVGWPKVLNISQNQGPDGQKCETFVKIRGRMAKFARHSSKSGATPGRRPADVRIPPVRPKIDDSIAL